MHQYISVNEQKTYNGIMEDTCTFHSSGTINRLPFVDLTVNDCYDIFLILMQILINYYERQYIKNRQASNLLSRRYPIFLFLCEILETRAIIITLVIIPRGRNECKLLRRSRSKVADFLPFNIFLKHKN